MTVAELIADLQARDPNALVVVMPYSDPVLVDEVNVVHPTSVVVNARPDGRRFLWRVYDAVTGTAVPAVALFDGT
jgi:hypothetical protein